MRADLDDSAYAALKEGIRRAAHPLGYLVVDEFVSQMGTTLVLSHLRLRPHRAVQR
jgi:hypothetical protein